MSGTIGDARKRQTPEPKVAVIDPANTADLERLAKLIANTGTLAEALTRYAAGEGLTPPKPAEPTGLGAVVEDEEGVLWTHTGLATISPWVRGGIGDWRDYGNIAVVRVLSEGVQPEPTPDPWASYYDRDLTVEDLNALPVGSVVVDRNNDKETKRADGWWGYDEIDHLRAISVARLYAPLRLVSVGGEGK